MSISRVARHDRIVIRDRSRNPCQPVVEPRVVRRVHAPGTAPPPNRTADSKEQRSGALLSPARLPCCSKVQRSGALLSPARLPGCFRSKTTHPEAPVYRRNRPEAPAEYWIRPEAPAERRSLRTGSTSRGHDEKQVCCLEGRFAYQGDTVFQEVGRLEATRLPA
ncbi:hypothetical protein NDU88_004753 [Pleurodeles waltl]|uniref:Uncharacterized protein n=1 Tax=Pleurodeles waltl TaxID=8319 RepID=A0AAV7L0S5_PLEWA|nr:hypothetical protein NDU88_004753 [Pleurodeles waltl]